MSDALSPVVIALFRGPIYRDEREVLWRSLITLRRRIDDYVSIMGMAVEVDEAKGYAFLRSDIDDEDPDAPPRLIPRRALSYQVSLLLALLRRRLAEHDASSSETRLVLSRDDIVRLLQDFLAGGANEARTVDRIDHYVKRACELGFLRELPGQGGAFEVRRILEAFVDAQWLAGFEDHLRRYVGHGTTSS